MWSNIVAAFKAFMIFVCLGTVLLAIWFFAILVELVLCGLVLGVAIYLVYKGIRALDHKKTVNTADKTK